jgi:hypothetical protein
MCGNSGGRKDVQAIADGFLLHGAAVLVRNKKDWRAHAP